jgi:transcriptional antiterminator
MAHFVKLSVLDPGHDDLENTTNRKYNSQLINLDMVINVEQSKVHSLIFTKNNTQHPIRVRESLDEILSVSKGCVKNVLNG